MTRLQSSSRRKGYFLNRVLIIYIWKKLISTEAVPTGIERQIFAILFKLGIIVSSISAVANSFNCVFILYFAKKLCPSSIRIYMYIYMYIHVCMYICIYMYIYVYTCIYMYVYIYVYICIYMYIHVCIYMYIYVYICIYMYICICICIQVNC